MITIKLQYDVDQQMNGFEISGHADFDDAGYDIVCAAVSVLSETALLGLLKYAKQYVHYEIHDGFLSVQLKQVSHETSIILETMVLGLEEVARQYTKFVVLDR